MAWWLPEPVLHAAAQLILCAALLGGGVTAVQADVVQRLETAFHGWVGEVGATAAVMTVWRQGTPQHDVGIGMSADAPVELASLSKMVTGLCAAHLIKQGRWTARTTSLEVLGIGPGDITVGGLLTHSAGIAPDRTQTRMPFWLDRNRHRASDVASRALADPLQTPGSYTYNNENYAVLGAMIAAETGISYAEYCTQHVLVAAGVRDAQPSARSGAFLSWGGWQMPVQSYAQLMHWGFGADGLIGADPGRWPQADMGGGVSYGVGMVQRPFQGAVNYWHFGALCFPGRMNMGSYAVQWQQDWMVVVFYDRCLAWKDMVALDQALAAAVFH